MAEAKVNRENWLTIEDIIRDTGLSRNTIYRAVGRGEMPVPVHRFGNQWLVSRKAWEELKDSALTIEGVTSVTRMEDHGAASARQ